LNHTIAYFVSPHGFGHAARASAVIQALNLLDPLMKFEIFTRAPRWFFETSLDVPFGYHLLNTDVGMAQRTPFDEDLAGTLLRLAEFIPFSPQIVEPLAAELIALNTSMVICDISPLGIAAAQAAGLKSVLVENFTWDWIYTGYLSQEPTFEKYIPLFSDWFARASTHIQTQPVCAPSPLATLTTHPVARSPKQSRAGLRARLGISETAQMVLISMGGFKLEYQFLEKLKPARDVVFVIPGGSQDRVETQPGLVRLPHHSDFYHPDLIHAADAVISKAGYSTIAEAFYAGIPFGFVSRPQFRESPILSAFIGQNMPGIEIDGSQFQNGSWLKMIDPLLALPRRQRTETNGAIQIARWVCTALQQMPAESLSAQKFN
jgi:hypothetical protein